MDKQTALLIAFNALLVLMVYLTRRKKKPNNFFLVLTTLLLSVSLMEFAYRMFFERETYYTGKFNQEFFQPDSVFGYKMKQPGHFRAIKTTNGRDTIFNTSYSIISDSGASFINYNHRVGFKENPDSTEFIFLGCSFTFGEGLSDRQSLPFLTGELNNVNAVNLGCIGYGVHQVYELFEEKFQRSSNRKKVFVYSFLYDHILRANGVYQWNQNGPYYERRGDLLFRSKQPINNPSTDKLIHYVSLFGSLRFLKKMLGFTLEKKRVKALTQDDYDKTFLMLQKMSTQIKVSGGRFILLDWDMNNWGNIELNILPVSMIEQKIDQLPSFGAEVVRASSITTVEDPANFIPGDGHPSAWMNYKIASYLGSLLKQQKSNSLSGQ